MHHAPLVSILDRPGQRFHELGRLRRGEGRAGELLAQAQRSGAKVILAGDDRQLASIEREVRRILGSMFSGLAPLSGSSSSVG